MNAGWTSPRNNRGHVGNRLQHRRRWSVALVVVLTLGCSLATTLVSAQGIQSPLIGGPFGPGIPNNGGIGIGPGGVGLNGAGQGDAGLAGNGAQGAGAMADFDSLMTLLQNTIEPETWQDLGGNFHDGTLSCWDCSGCERHVDQPGRLGRS